MDETGYRIEPLAAGHLGAIARVHRRVFPGYFLSNLGEGFLRLHYEDFLVCPLAFGFVAVDAQAGEVVGAVLGTMDAQALRRVVTRRHAGRKLLLALGRLCCSPRLWGQVAIRIARMLGTHLRRLWGASAPGVPSGRQDAKARLVSIGVTPEVRGRGAATALMRALEQEVVRRGADRVGLSVFADNARAIRFYEKTGWELAATRRGVVVFEKQLRAST